MSQSLDIRLLESKFNSLTAKYCQTIYRRSSILDRLNQNITENICEITTLSPETPITYRGTP